MCLSQYDPNGKFIATEEKSCCAKTAKATEVRIETTITNGKSKATITTTTNGKATMQVFEGTEAEVKAKVDALK